MEDIKSKRLLVIIPAFNEEKSIDFVLEDVQNTLPHADLVVVNDGSHDLTAETARRRGIILLDLPVNLGIGAAMQTGYKFAERAGYDITVQIDGDAQHPAGQVESLLEPLLAGEADLVIGSRFLEKNNYRAPWIRRLGMVLLSLAVSGVRGEWLRDTTSGFRAANRKVIRCFAREYPFDYPEVESLILLHRRGLRIKEVPVQMNRRRAGTSSITPSRSIYYMVKVLLSISVYLLRRD